MEPRLALNLLWSSCLFLWLQHRDTHRHAQVCQCIMKEVICWKNDAWGLAFKLTSNVFSFLAWGCLNRVGFPWKGWLKWASSVQSQYHNPLAGWVWLSHFTCDPSEAHSRGSWQADGGVADTWPWAISAQSSPPGYSAKLPARFCRWCRS